MLQRSLRALRSSAKLCEAFCELWRRAACIGPRASERGRVCDREGAEMTRDAQRMHGGVVLSRVVCVTVVFVVPLEGRDLFRAVSGDKKMNVIYHYLCVCAKAIARGAGGHATGAPWFRAAGRMVFHQIRVQAPSRNCQFTGLVW